MKKADKVTKIIGQLEDYYPETPVPLDHSDAFTLLIAVLLSAQATDKSVNLVTPALFAKAASPKEMALLKPEEVRQIIRTVGLAPTKSKNIVKLAQLLLSRHNGEVPSSLQALEALPGVGHKTASVVVSQWFGEPAFPVDTHIMRLAWRWGLSQKRTVVQTERDLKRLFPRDIWNKLHLQFIFFGREYCPARGHSASGCPICSWASFSCRLKE